MAERFSALDTFYGEFDKRMTERFSAVNSRIEDLQARFTGLEGRLDHKASNCMVSFCAAWVTTVIGTATAFIKRWP